MRVPHLLFFLSLLPLSLGSWFPDVFSTVLNVFEVAAEVGVSMVCPPLAPVVGTALSIGGALLENEVNKGFNEENEEGDSFNELTWRLEELEESIAENREIVLENQDEIRKNREEIFTNRNAILDNKELLVQNQQIALHNQDLILQNQDMLIGVQEMINKTAAESREFMDDLSSSLKTFEYNMNQNFDQLKTFMIEKDFVEKVTIPINNLWEAMEEATNIRKKRALDEFRFLYDKTRPLHLLKEYVVDRLGHVLTNPVSAAMFAQPINSRVILKHYMYTFTKIICKVMAIEGFFYGINDRTREATEENMKVLNQKIERAIDTIKQFFIEVTIPTDNYWPNLVEQTAKLYNDEANETIVADKIKEQLDGIYTKDAFNIFAFRCHAKESCEPTTLLRNAPPSGSRQKVMVDDFNKETRVRVVVMRSAQHHNASSDDTVALRSGYRAYMTLLYRWAKNPCDKGPFEEVLKGTLEEKQRNSLNGFLICNVDGSGAARITNNETAIIEDGDMVGDEQFYYGLSWA